MRNILKPSLILKILLNTYRQEYKKSVRFNLKQSTLQSGQAVFEYILMLVVTLSMIIGLAVHFIKPLGEYLKNNVGGYIECLLETGELPFILVSRPSTECDLDGLQASNVGEYRGMSTGGSGGEGGGTSGGADSNSNSNRGSQGGNSGGGGSGGSGGSGGGGGNNAPVQNRSGALNEAGGGAGAGGGGSSAGRNRGQRLVAKLDNETGNGGMSRGGSAFYKFGQDKGRGISGAIPVERKPEEAKLESVRNPTEPPKAKRDNQVETLRKSGFTAKLPAPQKAAGMDNDGGGIELNFSKYIRYLLIGGIIFALVLMVFLQLNSLRKSMSGGD